MTDDEIGKALVAAIEPGDTVLIQHGEPPAFRIEGDVLWFDHDANFYAIPFNLRKLREGLAIPRNGLGDKI